MSRKTKYDAKTLGPIVASSTSLSDVIRKLGLTPNGGNHRLISTRVRQAGLDISHFGSLTLRARVAAIPVDHLSLLVARSTSMAQVLKTLDLPTEGRAQHELTKRVRELQIDTSHLRGQGWSRGETTATHPTVARMVKARTMSDAEVFVENSSLHNTRNMRQRLRAMGWTFCCAICGLTEWRGKPIVLELDHINGINNDNRLENLRLLCPNCHSQTETYCRTPRTNPTKASEARTCYTSRRTRA